MFGLGMGEIIIIAIVALLVLGPDKLPDAAKSLSKGIRDFRKHSRDLQRTIEDDEQIGGAIRDIKSALRGEDLYVPPHLSREAEDDDDDDAHGDEHSSAQLTPGDEDRSAAGREDENAADAGSADAVSDAAAEPAPVTTTAASQANAGNAAASDANDDDDLPIIRPASGAVAHDPKDELTPTPATPSAADDAHG